MREDPHSQLPDAGGADVLAPDGTSRPGDTPAEQGDPAYRQCGGCGAPIHLRPPSATRPGQAAPLWSDGYVDTPDEPGPALLGKCRLCQAVACLPELPVMEDVPALARLGDYSYLPLTVDDYASLLESIEDISSQFHVYLRIKFWQLSNHRRRGEADPEPLSDAERANLVGLLKLLDDDDPGRLIKAEILRQLGQFEGAVAQLTSPVAPPLTPFVDRLRRLVDDGNANLVILFSGRPGDEMPEFPQS